MRKVRSSFLLAISLIFGGLAATPDPTYANAIQQWRTEREAKLKTDTGWLTVAGLFQLNPGENVAGTKTGSAIQLSDGAAPAELGVFTRRGQQISFKPAKGAKASINGKAISATTVLRWNTQDDNPDLLTHGSLTFFVIKRGDRMFLRMRDTNSKMRREFTGLHWYPIDPAYRITAKWVAYPAPRKVAIPTVIDQVIEEHRALGYAQFQLNGQEIRIEAVEEGKELFYIFKDPTAGKETYPAGRFLYSDAPKNGTVVLDFNKAYTPPCAFTPYATCPLPPKQNRLSVPIRAGELNYGQH